jgi:hypothetical protein
MTTDEELEAAFIEATQDQIVAIMATLAPVNFKSNTIQAKPEIVNEAIALVKELHSRMGHELIVDYVQTQTFERVRALPVPFTLSSKQ